MNRAKPPTSLRVTRWICLSAIFIAIAHDYTSLLNTTTREETRYRLHFLKEWERYRPPAAKEEKPKVEVPNHKYSHAEKL